MGRSAILLAISITTLAHAQQVGLEVTNEQIVQYKAKLGSGCVKDAVQSGLVVAQAQAFCGCMANQKNESMAYAEWQEAAYQSSKQAEKEEMKILVPHIRKAARACQPALK